MNQLQKGFTLIELIIIVAIIGILASIALSTYQEYVIRARIMEGLYLASGGKIVVNEAIANTGNLAQASAAWNAQVGGSGATSKYVISVLLNTDTPPTGVITITFNPSTVSVGSENTLVFSPYIRGSATSTPLKLAAAEAAGTTGTIDWVCTSNTSITALSSSIAAPLLGSLQAKYAPIQCR